MQKVNVIPKANLFYKILYVKAEGVMDGATEGYVNFIQYWQVMRIVNNEILKYVTYFLSSPGVR